MSDANLPAIADDLGSAISVMTSDPALYHSEQWQARVHALAEKQASGGTESIGASPGAVALFEGVKDALTATGGWSEASASFDRLPRTAIAAVSRELTDPPQATNRLVSPAWLQQFGADPAGRICLARWGASAPAKAMFMRQRAGRIFNRLLADAPPWQRLADWLDDLEPADAAVVMSALAEPPGARATASVVEGAMSLDERWREALALVDVDARTYHSQPHQEELERLAAAIAERDAKRGAA